MAGFVLTPDRMPQRRRRLTWVILIAAMLVAAVIGGERWLEHFVTQRSYAVLQELGGSDSRVSMGLVEATLLTGDITWTDVRIDGPASWDTSLPSLRARGSVGTVAIRGLSYWRLLFGRTLAARSITIERPYLDLLMPDTIITDQRGARSGITRLKIAEFMIDRARLRMSWPADSSLLSTDTMTVSLTALAASWSDVSRPDIRFETVKASMANMQAFAAPLYAFRAARIELGEEGRQLSVVGAVVEPVKGPEDYDEVVHFETDLIAGRMDTLSMTHVDLMSLINERTLRTACMRIAGVEMHVHRDKTMPDAPFKHKPLPARLIRELPIALCMDSLVLDRWNVTYHERNGSTPDYGEVAFNELHARIDGLCSVGATNADTLVVRASAQGFDRADIALELRTVIADSSDRFTARARVGALPFGVFNRMTDDLMLVRATAGTMRGISLTMTGNDRQATGMVNMEYDGLAFEVLKKDGSREQRKLLTGLLNSLVRKGNDNDKANYREGDLKIDRRRDRQIFNYLWSALREGMLVTAMPGVVEAVRDVQHEVKKR